PFTVIMEVAEVEHFKRSNTGMQKTMWTNFFNDIFKKHIARRALNAAFELNFDDETVAESSGDNIPEYRPTERKDITPQAEVIDAPPAEEPKEQTEDEQIKKLRRQIS